MARGVGGCVDGVGTEWGCWIGTMYHCNTHRRTYVHGVGVLVCVTACGAAANSYCILDPRNRSIGPSRWMADGGT